MMLSLDPMRRLHDKTKPYWKIPILKTSSLKGQGLVELADAIEQHRAYLAESGTLAQRTRRQVRSEIETLILHAVSNALKREVSAEEWQRLVEDITTRERDPYSVAADLEQRIGLQPS